MFRGRSVHSLDQKGRVAIPARFREVIRANGDERLVITNLDRCLVAYPFEEWRKLENEAAKLSSVEPQVLAWMRYFISGATEVNLDKQGRVLISPDLRKFAGLADKVTLSGMLNRFEIWDQERWEQEMERSQAGFEDISRSLAQLGI